MDFTEFVSSHASTCSTINNIFGQHRSQRDRFAHLKPFSVVSLRLSGQVSVYCYVEKCAL